MSLFSERYGYIKPSEVIIRERITPEIQNAICSCFDRLEKEITREEYKQVNRLVWVYFLNNREQDFDENKKWWYKLVTSCILVEDVQWYRVLDIVEFVVKYAFANSSIHYYLSDFIDDFNSEFSRLNFAYRIVDNEIVEMTSESEIDAVETALAESTATVRRHLNEALKLMSQRPTPDSRNSIKESISAVEAFCREKTGESTLGKALSKLEASGIKFPKMLKEAFEKFYAYTNQKETGIRHSLMDEDGTYVPSADEAMFMLVSCSAFISYLSKKGE